MKTFLRVLLFAVLKALELGAMGLIVWAGVNYNWVYFALAGCACLIFFVLLCCFVCANWNLVKKIIK